jgi:hypothetical protein
MTTEIFSSWLKESFIPQVPHRPAILLLDGHRSHVSLEAIDIARRNKIILIKLPAHTTHLLQPCDKSCFKPLKDIWRKKVTAYQRENGFRNINKSNCVDLLCAAWQEALTPSTIISGFTSTGVFPPNREMYPKDQFDEKRLAAYYREKMQPEFSATMSSAISGPLTTPTGVALSSPLTGSSTTSTGVALSSPLTGPCNMKSPSLHEVSMMCQIYACIFISIPLFLFILSSLYKQCIVLGKLHRQRLPRSGNA